MVNLEVLRFYDYEQMMLDNVKQTRDLAGDSRLLSPPEAAII